MNQRAKNKIWQLLDSKRSKYPTEHFLDVNFVKEMIDTNKLNKEEIDALESIILGIQRNRIGEYVTPNNLVRFLTKIIQPNDSDVVIDPVCGTGSFLKELYEENSKASYFGIDINSKIIDWAKEFAKHREQEINFLNQNSLEDFPTTVPKANYIFANLPFGARVSNQQLIENYEIQSKELDVLLIQKIIKSLKQDGIAFIITTEGLLFRKSAERLRQFISEKASLDAIISLPTGTFAPYTNIKTSVLIISNSKKNKTALYELENIREDSKVIEDIRAHLSGKQTSYGEVIENFSQRESWPVSSYYDEVNRQHLLDAIPHKYELKKIRDICKINTLSPQDINREDIDLIISSTYTPGKLLSLEEIQDKSSKARYFALKITDPKVSKDYLKSLLNSRYASLEAVSTGMVIKTLNKKALEDFEVPIVDEEIQNQLEIKLSNIEAVKDKVTSLITEIEKVEDGNIFNFDYDPESSLNALVSSSRQYHESLPKPIAISYFSYKNTQNIDKKFDSIVTSYSTIIKTLGLISLIGLSTIDDKNLPDKIRGEIDPSRPISDGVWGKLVQLAVKRCKDMNCFLSDELKYIDYREIVSLTNELTANRNKKAHNTRAYSKIQKEAFNAKFQNDLDRLLDLFSFLTKAPLVYFEKTEKFPPQKIVHTVRYLVGDDMHDKEDNIELREDFYQTLYLLKNIPNKSISMYPLMIYEDSVEIESKDIFLFSGLDKRDNPYYLGLTKGEEIVREEYRDDVHRVFYYISEK